MIWHGRVWEDTPAKDASISYWCREVSQQTGSRWRYLRVNQADFDEVKLLALRDFEDLVAKAAC